MVKLRGLIVKGHGIKNVVFVLVYIIHMQDPKPLQELVNIELIARIITKS